MSGSVRICSEADRPVILTIINAAAQAYRGIIPDDRWHDPYMSSAELDSEIAAGVEFWGYEIDQRLVGVMGVQTVKNVLLIRHAYVSPEMQGRGVGGILISHLGETEATPMLVGTWSDAHWAIRFYERWGFALVPQSDVAPLLRAYWAVPERQIETSTVLARPALGEADASLLIAASSEGKC